MPFLRVLLFMCLPCLVAEPCGAMISVEDVTPRRARELGVTFRTTTNGIAGIRVWVEARAEKELAKITYAEVKIGEGDGRIMSAHLRERRLKEGRRTFLFSVRPRYLSQSSVMLVVYNGPRGAVGYRFRLSRFIRLGGAEPAEFER